MKRTMIVSTSATLARILNLAERCNCTYSLLSSEQHGDQSYYHVNIELEGASEALRLLDSQINRILNYDKEFIL